MSLNYFNLVAARRHHNNLRKLKRRGIRDAHNPFELPNWEFRKYFRINKEVTMFLCQELGKSLEPVNNLDGLPVHLKVLTCVRLLGDVSYQQSTGQEHTVSIAQTTVSKYLAQFVDSVIKILLPKWVYFPGTESQRQSVADGFNCKYGIPNVIGAIDCTHVAIVPPKKPLGVQYKNNKGFHSINTQLVCDVNGRILHINARYPGRVNDQFIFNHSNLKKELQRLHGENIGSYFLLGDSGYDVEPWLMTPVLDALPDSPEQNYNEWHCRVRYCIEKVNRDLKGTFRCLGHDRVLHYHPEKASKIIYTCATLYNIMLHYRVSFETIEEGEDMSPDDIFSTNSSASLLHGAEDKRRNIINTYFT